MNTYKKALVTGASRGIGREVAKRLAGEGLSLVLVCEKRMDLLTEQAAEYEKDYGVQVALYQGSVADSAFVCDIFAKEKDIDLVINNAGIACVKLLTDMTDEDYHRVMGVNLDGTFYVCREAAKAMLQKHHGRIYNITSIWGEVGASMESIYSASKAGIIGLTKALAKELAPSGIQVNAISLGVMDTEMNHIFSKEEMTDIVSEIPADRMGRPQEAADLIWSLLNAPDYMTGQVIRMDGGFI